MHGWTESSAVMKSPGMLLWLLGALSARTMDHARWTQLRMMMDRMESSKGLMSWTKGDSQFDRKEVDSIDFLIRAHYTTHGSGFQQPNNKGLYAYEKGKFNQTWFIASVC